jgi:hypothetical protein
MAYPLIVFMVSAVFCFIVLRQFGERRRPYQLAWAISLGCAAAGSLSYVVFLAADRPEIAFRLYYICGALLTAPMLGLGSLLLASRTPAAQRRTRRVVVGLTVACCVDGVLLLVSPIHESVLRLLDGGPGTDPPVYAAGPWEPLLVVVNVLGALLVVGVAIYSGWQLYRHAGSRRLLVANALIAAGTYAISQAGGQARTGFGAGAFWLTMALGWIVLFGGFLCTFSPRVEAAPARRAPGRADAATA